MAEESYEFKYDTGKNMQRIFGFVSIFLILMMFILPSLIIYFVIGLSLTGMLFLTARQNYREMLLYDDKMQMRDISGTVLMEVYFAEVKRIGFLHGTITSTGVGRSSIGTYSGEIAIEEFVILFNDGREFKINDGFDNMQDIAAYVKQKIGQDD